jgi:polysaccharide biosynthesis/export protein
MRGTGTRNRLGLFLAFVALAANAGCTTTHDPLPAPHAATIGQPTAGGVPTELNKIQLPPYVIEAPDVLLIDVYTLPKEKGQPATVLLPQPIGGQHLIRPDGYVNLGIWGSVSVTGLTTEQAKERIRGHVFEKMKTDPVINQWGNTVDDPAKLFVAVDVLVYNSKVYYVITDGAGYGEQMASFPIQGNETVMDALAKIGGLPSLGSKQSIWIARRTPFPGQPEQILHFDYVGATQHALTTTNYQIFPGDRIYIRAERVFRVDGFLQKMLTPVERLLGVTLLGSSAVNSIRNRNNTNNNNGF